MRTTYVVFSKIILQFIKIKIKFQIMYCVSSYFVRFKFSSCNVICQFDFKSLSCRDIQRADLIKKLNF